MKPFDNSASMNPESCLPPRLRRADTTITKVAAGLSGAGVFKVEADGEAYVLKISDAGEPVMAWRRKLRIQQGAADAGVAPAIVHVDEERRAILSTFVVDRFFRVYFNTPTTRDEALELLGRTLRRVHDIPVPPGVEPSDPRKFLTGVWSGLGGFAIPPFVDDAIRAVLSERPPERDRAFVLSHNDVNPSNLIYDGERLVLLDWDTAGANDPLFDLAAVSLFLRMDDETCRRLLAAHDGAPVDALPPRFAWNRRVAGLLVGTMFLHLARQGGHTGATGTETLESTEPLAAFYQRLRAGNVNIASSEGQWAFGLALAKEALG